MSALKTLPQVKPSKKIRSKFCVWQELATGKIEVVGDFRGERFDVGWKKVIDWTNYYHVLRSTLAQDVTIVIKPRLNDILFVRQSHKNKGARNRIDRKHVDFLLCETATMTPRLVVELDDRSHQKKDRQERDELVDGALKAAGLPILHVSAVRGYVPQELFAQIQQAIQNTSRP